MADRNVDIVIRGRDQASKQLNSIGRNLRKFRGEVASTVRTAALSAGIVFGVGGIVRAGKQMLEAASFAEESGNRFDEVFKEQAETSAAFAIQLGKDTHRSQIRIKDYMATLQDTFVPLGLTREKAAELSGELVKLAIDVGSFKDVSDSEVIENFTSALVGQSKAVLKYGIVTNITALKQELFNQGIKKTFEELTVQEKVLLRYNVIQRSTRDAQGDVIRTSRSYANELKALKDTIFETSAAMGAMPLPFLATGFRNIRLNVESTMKVFQNWQLSSEIVFASTQLAMAKFEADFNHFFLDTAPMLLEFFKDNWQSIFDTINNAAGSAVVNMAANIFDLSVTIKDFILGGEFDFTWTPLLDGFESTMKEFPNIVKREMTEVEKTLQSSLRDLLREFDKNPLIRKTDTVPGDTDEAGGVAGLLGRRKGPSAIGGRFLTFNAGARANPQLQLVQEVRETNRLQRQLLAATERSIRLDEMRRRKAGLSFLTFE